MQIVVDAESLGIRFPDAYTVCSKLDIGYCRELLANPARGVRGRSTGDGVFFNYDDVANAALGQGIRNCAPHDARADDDHFRTVLTHANPLFFPPLHRSPGLIRIPLAASIVPALAWNQTLFLNSTREQLPRGTMQASRTLICRKGGCEWEN